MSGLYCTAVSKYSYGHVFTGTGVAQPFAWSHKGGGNQSHSVSVASAGGWEAAAVAPACQKPSALLKLRRRSLQSADECLCVLVYLLQPGHPVEVCKQSAETNERFFGGKVL